MNEDEKKPRVFMSVETTEEYLIDRARKNIVDFIVYVSGGEHRPAAHHLEWLYYILNPEFPHVNIIAPRGSAKTTMLVYVLAYMIGKNPIKTNAIFSASTDLADGRLREVKDLIETNVAYRNVFPWIELDYKRPNNASRFDIKCSRWKGKDIDYATWRSIVVKYGQKFTPTLLSKGIQASGIAGNRFTGLVLLDDIHDEKNSATSEQRAKVVISVKKVVMPCLWKLATPKMVSICTRWAEDDYSGTVAEERRKNSAEVWKTLVIPAISYEEDGKAVSYWEEAHSIETLEETREEIGEVMFQLMYMLNPKAASSSEFTIDMLRKGLPESFPEGFFREIFISCDFAETVGKKSDYTVFAAIGRDFEKRFNYYILDIKRFKKSKIGDKIEELTKFADNIFSQYGQLNGILMEERDSATEAAELHAVRSDLTLRVVQAKGDKVERYKALAPYGQGLRIYCNIHMKEYAAMCSELIGFPATHDDIVDALDLPFQQPTWAVSYERAGSTPFSKEVKETSWTRL